MAGELIPGASPGVLSGVGSSINSMMGTIGAVIGAAVIVAFIIGIMLLINYLFFTHVIPVTLKKRIGETVIVEQDLMVIKKKKDRYEVSFKRNKNLIVEEPPDRVALMFKIKGKIKKGFEGYVTDTNQVAWLDPLPKENGLVTIPTNLIRHYVSMSRQNAEMNKKLKWFENPITMGYVTIGIFVVAIVFIYLMHKGMIEEVGRLIDVGTQVMKTAGMIK